MDKKKKIFTYFFLVLFTITNIGFVSQFNYCEENSKLVLNIFDDKCCCPEEEIVTYDCCSGETEEVPIENNCENGCLSTTEYNKLESNQIFSFIKDYKAEFTLICLTDSFEPNNGKPSNSFIKFIASQTLEKSGKNIIISHHQLKIPFPDLV